MITLSGVLSANVVFVCVYNNFAKLLPQNKRKDATRLNGKKEQEKGLTNCARKTKLHPVKGLTPKGKEDTMKN